MVLTTTVPARLCTCDKCGYSWVLYEGNPPIRCASKTCRTREWNGKKQQVRSHVNEIKLPAPRSGGRPKIYVGGGDGICLDD